MNLKQITALLPNFTNDVLNDFQTTNDEFKSICVQEAFKILERRKMDAKLAGKKDFWERFCQNVELLTLQFREVLKQQGNTPNKQQRITQFFKYYDREIKS
jgi:uncharacterized LabA/DUF88 family protein